ncbi:MAG: hypothetical protein M1813_007017 [Trichoglossum hirsutum]|nr:MAG: hypothetical protein M1813_007017 [Trichoglossum hirsutum]
MKRDLKESFEVICGGSANMKQHIHEIRQHLTSRDKAQQWARRLRFITMDADLIASEADNGSPSDNDEVDGYSSTSCSCERKRYFMLQRDGAMPKRLYLSEPGEICDCEHYVAISYRWPGRDVKLEEAYAVRTSNGDRKNRAPKTILDRAIRFAMEVGLKLIWIDQECIEQDDRLDKELGIQSMDQVFQNALIAIAVLNCKITKQEHLDALFDLVEGREDMSRVEVVHALEVLELIFADDWHSRAWCFQEISVSQD